MKNGLLNRNRNENWLQVLRYAGIILVGVSLLIGAVSATTWHVDNEGGAGIDFTKIQDAVDAAQDNDTIIVYNGTYNGNLTLNKQLTLKGRGMPVVDAGVSGSVITVHANECIIDGFKISRSGYGLKDAGIKVESDKNIIKSNIISNNWCGIHLRKRVSNNTIQDNKVVSNKYIGLSLDSHASNNIVLNNSINSNEDDGIEMDNSDNNIISNNTISLNNGKGIYVKDGSDNNMVCNNTILRNNGDGIRVGWYSSNNKIINNEIEFNDDDGIDFRGHTSCNVITNNTISFNDDGGIVLKTSHNNTIRSNTITSNDEMGIKLESAPNNSVYHNNLVDNAPNGYDDTGANNSWDNGPIIGGNYWDDHTCDGNPSNGCQSYHIDKYGVDNYPFEEPIADAPPLPPPQPKSQIHLHKEKCLSTKDTHIDPSQIYDFTTNWSANVWEVKNLANVTYKITTTKNFIYINNWELYQNGTDNSFILPPSIEGTTYTWIFPLKDHIGSGINFILDSPKIVQDNPWVDMDVSTMNEDNYTRLNITFTPVISIDWVNLNIIANQIIDTRRFPSEFDLVPYTSNRIEFNSGEINQGHTYEFSILVKEPDEVNIWLDRSFGWVKNPPSDTITVPVAELGSVTVTADVPVKWEHTAALPQYVQSITINMGAKHP